MIINQDTSGTSPVCPLQARFRILRSRCNVLAFQIVPNNTPPYRAIRHSSSLERSSSSFLPTYTPSARPLFRAPLCKQTNNFRFVDHGYPIHRPPESNNREKKLRINKLWTHTHTPPPERKEYMFTGFGTGQEKEKKEYTETLFVRLLMLIDVLLYTFRETKQKQICFPGPFS